DMPEGGIFPPGRPAGVRLGIRLPLPGDAIMWTITAADRRQLASGSGDGGVEVQLEPLFTAGDASLWLDARLLRGGRQIDVLRRVFGRPSAPAAGPATTDRPGGKAD